VVLSLYPREALAEQAYFADPDGTPWEVAFNPFFPFGPDGDLKLD